MSLKAILIYRVINNKWLIKIPKQPLKGIAFHKNDSFRELALLYKKNRRLVIMLLTCGT